MFNSTVYRSMFDSTPTRVIFQIKGQKQIPLDMVPSRPSFLDDCFGTRCDGAYSTRALNWEPGKKEGKEHISMWTTLFW